MGLWVRYAQWEGEPEASGRARAPYGSARWTWTTGTSACGSSTPSSRCKSPLHRARAQHASTAPSPCTPAWTRCGTSYVYVEERLGDVRAVQCHLHALAELPPGREGLLRLRRLRAAPRAARAGARASTSSSPSQHHSGVCLLHPLRRASRSATGRCDWRRGIFDLCAEGDQGERARAQEDKSGGGGAAVAGLRRVRGAPAGDGRACARPSSATRWTA